MPAVRSLAVLGAGLLLAASVLCARWGHADLVATDAINRLNLLQQQSARTGEPLAARDVNMIVASLLLAQSLEPDSPYLAEQLGGVYALDVREGGTGGAVSRQWAKAFDQYSKAVVLRPTSPYSWANRAWTKYYLGQVDDEFYRALVHAMALGPWEVEVQFVVADLGFALWEVMPVELQPQVLAIAQNSQGRYATQIAAIAQKRGRLAEVCKFEKVAKLPVCKALAG